MDLASWMYVVDPDRPSSFLYIFNAVAVRSRAIQDSRERLVGRVHEDSHARVVPSEACRRRSENVVPFFEGELFPWSSRQLGTCIKFTLI